MTSGVAEGVQKYRAGRPIARVDVGTAKVRHAFQGTVFALYKDRIETPKGTHPLTPAVHAEVDAAGGFQRRRDRRELYLTVEGEGWSITRQCDPRKGEKVRRFAHAVNSAVQALQAAPVSDPPAPGASRVPSPPLDAAEAIQKLADLHDAGVLTAEEFESKMRDLLSRM
jgi:hypothetical protein